MAAVLLPVSAPSSLPLPPRRLEASPTRVLNDAGNGRNDTPPPPRRWSGGLPPPGLPAHCRTRHTAERPPRAGPAGHLPGRPARPPCPAALSRRAEPGEQSRAGGAIVAAEPAPCGEPWRGPCVSSGIAGLHQQRYSLVNGLRAAMHPATGTARSRSSARTSRSRSTTGSPTRPAWPAAADPRRRGRDHRLGHLRPGRGLRADASWPEARDLRGRPDRRAIAFAGVRGCRGPVAELGGMRFPVSATAFYHYLDLVALQTRPFPNPLPQASGSTVIDLDGVTHYASRLGDLPPLFIEVADAWAQALEEGASPISRTRSARATCRALKSLWNIRAALGRPHLLRFRRHLQGVRLAVHHREVFGQVGFGTGGWDSDFPTRCWRSSGSYDNCDVGPAPGGRWREQVPQASGGTRPPELRRRAPPEVVALRCTP